MFFKRKNKVFDFNNELDNLNINGSGFKYIPSKPYYEKKQPYKLKRNIRDREKLEKKIGYGYNINPYHNTYEIFLKEKRYILSVYENIINLYNDTDKFVVLLKNKKPKTFGEFEKFSLYLQSIY